SASRLASSIGVSELLLKCEGVNPTGSFKDRGSVTGVLRAGDLGFKYVGTVSTGNMAMSMAAYAARLDLGCLILTSVSVPSEKLKTITMYNPTLYKYIDDYGQLYFDSLSLSRELPIYFVNGD